MNEESPHPPTRGAEWIAEAIADLTERLGEPLVIAGMADLVRELRRCADALEQLAAPQEEANEAAEADEGRRHSR